MAPDGVFFIFLDSENPMSLEAQVYTVKVQPPYEKIRTSGWLNYGQLATVQTLWRRGAVSDARGWTEFSTCFEEEALTLLRDGSGFCRDDSCRNHLISTKTATATHRVKPWS